MERKSGKYLGNLGTHFGNISRKILEENFFIQYSVFRGKLYFKIRGILKIVMV